ncbi:hypothetical protein [Marinicellulosiphila megalodicopiae]|uniref:hypothetical protein n=1 Tax=Marinicellulosiphila megalodicopiae TaxID=2724896 RepID=UPI003BAEB631
MSDQDPKMQTSSKLLISTFLVCALICVGLIVATAFFGSPMGNSETKPRQQQPQSQESLF